MIRKALLCAVLISSVGCFRTTVETGAPAGETKIDLPWQKSWVFGLVPPDTINTRATCPNGVSKVMVEHSFLNGLVRALTWSMFTPIHPVVTCAR
ncbi:MAG: hypothetical protein H7066_10195 [Cytophagaceae bacterium]|nr:hypothetical protein [Gemmatimonadaceae bacterium]